MYLSYRIVPKQARNDWEESALKEVCKSINRFTRLALESSHNLPFFGDIATVQLAFAIIIIV